MRALFCVLLAFPCLGVAKEKSPPKAPPPPPPPPALLVPAPVLVPPVVVIPEQYLELSLDYVDAVLDRVVVDVEPKPYHPEWAGFSLGGTMLTIAALITVPSVVTLVQQDERCYENPSPSCKPYRRAQRTIWVGGLGLILGGVVFGASF